MPELNRSPEKLLPNKTVQLTPDPIMRIKKKRNITAGVGVGDVGGDVGVADVAGGRGNPGGSAGSEGELLFSL